MSEIKLSNRYAKALLDEAIQKSNVDVAYSDMVFVKESISQSVELSSLLKSPIINSGNKIQVLSKVFTSLTPATINFIQFLVEKNRERYLFDISEAFISQYYNHKGITLIEITSPVSLDSASIDRILDSTKKQMNLKEVKVSTKVDEKILGGLVLKIGDKVLDASIASRLENFKRTLTA
jgi:F-type H+-transporting ATPase subunit delta